MDKQNLHEYISESESNICQIEVLKDGKSIYSDTWHNYLKTDTAHIMSATKSIVSLLVGIAIDKGYIHSVEDKVLSYFPEYVVKRGEKTIYDVRIKHLLTMRAPYKGKGDPWTKVCSSENWVYSSLDFLGGKSGITDEFCYRTVCLHILSGILYKATGMNTVDFANKYLFNPLGIPEHTNYYAKTAEEHKRFTLDKEPKKDVWFADPMGLGTPGYGLCLSALDMAKIGDLCLNKGKDIVSENWINEITTPRKVESSMFRNMDYGYLWWIIHPLDNIYAAIGNSGNVIYVNPEKNISVGITSYFNPRVFDRIDFIEEVLIPDIL